MRLTAAFAVLCAATALAQDASDAGAALIETREQMVGAADAGALETPPQERVLEAYTGPAVDAPVDAQTTPAPAAEGQAPPQGFVKGELSVYLGSDRLTVKRNRIGVSAGVDRFLSAFYLLVEPQVDLRFLDAQLGIGIGVPLRLELVDFADSPNLTKDLGRLRVEDYDTVHDFGRILKYVSYGRKEDNLYVNVGQRYATSIGHGAVMRRYAPNLDPDYPRASAEVDAYNDWGGFELFSNDLLEWNQLAGIAFVKPFGVFGAQNPILKSLSVGISAGLDRNAPMTLTTDANGVRQLVDGRLAASTRPVGLVGFDIEAKVVKTENIDLKPYIDYSMLIGGEGGLTFGALGRFNVGTDVVHAFRGVVELRWLQSRYQPSYFDTFYEVDRFVFRQVGTTAAGLMQFATKQDQVLGAGLGQRFGYYFEASYGIRGKVGVTFALEGVSNDVAKNFVAHLEVPVLSFLQVFGSYYKRNFSSFGELFTPDEKAVAFAGLRLRTLPFLFINGRVYKTFRVNPDVQRYDNQFGFVVDLEVGWEFGRAPGDAPAAPAGTTPASDPAPAPGTTST